MKELSIEEKAKRYDEAKARMSRAYNSNRCTIGFMNEIFPEFKDEDERIRKELIKFVKVNIPNEERYIAWLEKQKIDKEINLAEILKHYPKETELYSPLYGKLWLAEVDEKNEIIICYKHPLEEGCTRAILPQEDAVSFYSNGTTGLPDYTVSKDCMLFLYNIEKQVEQEPVDYNEELKKCRENPLYFFDKYVKVKLKEQKPAWSEEDKKMCQETIDWFEKKCFPYALESENPARESIKWLKSLKDRYTWKPSDEQIMCLQDALSDYHRRGYKAETLETLLKQLKQL